MSDGTSTMVRFLTPTEDGPGLGRHCPRQARRRRNELIECLLAFRVSLAAVVSPLFH